MLLQTITYRFPADYVDAAIEHLRIIERESVKEPGCRAFIVYRKTDDPRTFFLYELWEDQAAIDYHFTQQFVIDHVVNGIRILAEERRAATFTPLFPDGPG